MLAAHGALTCSWLRCGTDLSVSSFTGRELFRASKPFRAWRESTTKTGSSSVTRHVTEEDAAAERLSSHPRGAEALETFPSTRRLRFHRRRKPSATRRRRERQNTRDNCHTGLKGPRRGTWGGFSSVWMEFVFTMKRKLLSAQLLTFEEN